MNRSKVLSHSKPMGWTVRGGVYDEGPDKGLAFVEQDLPTGHQLRMSCNDARQLAATILKFADQAEDLATAVVVAAPSDGLAAKIVAQVKGTQ